ncbi:MAG: glutamate formimidoyltransferase [Candidatus Marinimicrobia bacterium]|nr:glutamate formimidoyltransferase [Candidatus Neomarinimicrobiota bacterium]
MRLIECVPNFSEGRDLNKIRLITNAIESVDGITLLDVDPGSDTNRTVVTFVGSPEIIAEAAFQGIKTASEQIDMSKHKGAHPRMGATDVCPLVPVSNVTKDECIIISKLLAERVGNELNIPVYLYEDSAQTLERKNLSLIREGEYEGLSSKIIKSEWKPDFGPSEFNSRSGASVIGARDFLIAYNINLNTRDERLATDIAFELRESGRSKRIPNPNSPNLLDGEIVRKKDGKPVKVPGLFKDLKGVGWYLPELKRAQISLNFNNYNESTLHHVFDKACVLAQERGVRVTGSELVGLVPMEAMLMAGRHYLTKQRYTKGIPLNDIIEVAIQSLGLNDIVPFNTEEKIIENAVKNSSNKLMSLKSDDFINELSTNSAAPGGGSVSALAGSLGAALISMVSALNHEKKENIKIKPQMEKIGIEAQKIKDRLSFLVDEDTNAFNQLIKANRMPSSNNKQEKEKLNAIQKANEFAIEIPLEVISHCLRIIELSEELIDIGNPNLVSDAGVSAEVSLAGVRGAAMNVLINLIGIDDDSYCNKKRELVNKFINDAEKNWKIVFDKTMKKIIL